MEKIVIFFKEANVHMFLFLFFIKFLLKKTLIYMWIKQFNNQ